MLAMGSTTEPHPQPIQSLWASVFLSLLPHLCASVKGKKSHEDLIYKLAP